MQSACIIDVVDEVRQVCRDFVESIIFHYPTFPKWRCHGVTLDNCGPQIKSGVSMGLQGSMLTACELQIRRVWAFCRPHNTGIEPLLLSFAHVARQAGLGGGLRGRMAARIFPKMLRGTATPASWKGMARA